MTPVDNEEARHKSILVYGHSASAITFLESLRVCGFNAEPFDNQEITSPDKQIICLCLDGHNLDLQSLSYFSFAKLIVHVSSRLNTKIRDQIHFLNEHLASNPDIRATFFVQDAASKEEIQPLVPRHKVASAYLNLPFSSLSFTKPKSEKKQIGLFIQQELTKESHEFISDLQTRNDIVVRIWEDQKLNDFSQLPKSWSIYRPSALSFQKFAQLCDTIAFLDIPKRTRHIATAINANNLVLCPFHHAPKPFDEFVTPFNNIQEVLETKERQDSFPSHINLKTYFSHDIFKATFQNELEPTIQAIRSSLEKKKKSKKPVLFISTNGIGLGHITRLLSVARRCPDDIEPVFAVFSAGVRLVQEAGYICEHLVSNEYAETMPTGWHDHVNTELRAIIRYYEPEAIVYDGNVLYPGVVRAISSVELPLIWIRRGLFREGADYGPLHSQIYADILIEPGEIAATYDKGPTSDRKHQVFWPRQYLTVPPVVYPKMAEVLSKEKAQDELGLSKYKMNVLIQVGAGNLSDTNRLIEELVTKIQERSEASIFVAQWPISDRPALPHKGVEFIKKYPLSPYLNAFDFVVSATGYNSFHELMAIGVPTILIANEFTRLDDQSARANFAADNRYALMARAEESESISRALDQILNKDTRETLRSNSQEITWKDGAQEIVTHLKAILDDSGTLNE